MSRASENVIRFFQAKSPEPQPWGMYHLLCLGVLAALVAALIAGGRRLRKSPKTVRRLTACLGSVLLAAEILKQIFSSVQISDGKIIWDYPWHIFPFQLCSTPLYVCIALFFLPEGRVRRALCCYLGTFGIVGGAVVMAAPESVYITSLFINVHTMVWHTGLILLHVPPDSSPIFLFVWENVPYPLYLICYIAGFILLTGLIFAVLRIPLRRAAKAAAR